MPINPDYKKLFYGALAFGLGILPAAAGAAVELKDPLGLSGNGDKAIPMLANRFIQTALGISGILALIAFVYGGLLYMLAGVNPKNVDKGKEMMKYAIIGLFVIFFSYAMVNFYISKVLQVPTSAGTAS